MSRPITSNQQRPARPGKVCLGVLGRRVRGQHRTRRHAQRRGNQRGHQQQLHRRCDTEPKEQRARAGADHGPYAEHGVKPTHDGLAAQQLQHGALSVDRDVVQTLTGPEQRHDREHQPPRRQPQQQQQGETERPPRKHGRGARTHGGDDAACQQQHDE